jgi:hypothetical protein
LQAEWEDWAAAVRIAVRSAMEIRQPGQPLLLVGYSNGGLLAINYALQCIDDDALPCPDRIVLLSPAIAVSNAGLLANLHPGLSWLPYFEQFKWLSVLPEIDPFKFNSFPKKAAWEIRRGATITERLLGNSRRVAALPPVLTFQSIVDRTVVADGLVSRLYRRLPRNGSELVIYDVNRNISLLQLMTRVPVDPLTTFESIAPLDYSVHIVRNVASDTLDVELATLNAGIERFSFTDTGMQWPLGVFSLSHIAIPFAPFDTLYGDGSNTGATGSNLVLGATRLHQSLDAELSGLGFLLSQNWRLDDVRQRDEARRVRTFLEREFPKSFDVEAVLVVADRPADFDKDDVRRSPAPGRRAGAARHGKITQALFHFAGDVRNHLHITAEVIAAAFAFKDFGVDLPGGAEVLTREILIENAFVGAQVHVTFGAVFKNKDLAVAVWIQRARIDIEIAFQFDGRDGKALVFEQFRQGRTEYALAQPGHDRAQHNDVGVLAALVTGRDWRVKLGRFLGSTGLPEK